MDDVNYVPDSRKTKGDVRFSIQNSSNSGNHQFDNLICFVPSGMTNVKKKAFFCSFWALQLKPIMSMGCFTPSA